MRFERIYIDRDNYYSIGIDRDSGQHLMEVVVTGVAWHYLYFRLTPEELAAFERDNQALTPLSYELAADKGSGKFADRLVPA
jgi:hypothetical protein